MRSNHDYNSPRRCAVCGVQAHPREFRHFLSDEQAEMFGYYNSHAHPKGVATDTCADCLVGVMGDRTLPPHAGYHLLANGVNGEEIELSTLVRALRDKNPVGVNKTPSRHTLEAASLFDAADKALLADRVKATKQKSIATSDEVRQFYETYQLAVQAAHAKLRVLALTNKRGGAGVVRDTPALSWVDLLGEDQHEALIRMWQELPPQYLSVKRKPLLLLDFAKPNVFSGTAVPQSKTAKPTSTKE